MSLSLTLLTFVNVWCLMLFFVLAFSVKAETNPAPTDYAAAPQTFPWRQKLKLNTWISAGVTFAIWLIIKLGLIPLHTIIDGI